ncbi:MAG TPA: hypothetical protein PK070_07745 [Synergistaceae bacterium]|nr:hypothetical protein [Synergistaceae bacterium]HQA55416.1 hypothetical protein [Synergistaceae bacterium]
MPKIRGRVNIEPTFKRRSALIKDVLFLILTLMKITGTVGSVRFSGSAGSPSVSGTLEEEGPFPAVRVPIGTGRGPS